GEMRPLWGDLHKLTMPVTILVGERDTKFHTLGRRMEELLPQATFTLVPGGHVLPLESPAAVAEAIV
ncbi:MAG: alpha/beta fold hydrolase, partial [Solirubrobacteraceae bacterium]